MYTPVLLVGTLAFAGRANAYAFEGDDLTKATLAVRSIFAFTYLILFILSIPALFVARGHRLAYLPLLFGVFLSFIKTCAQLGLDIITADVDPFDDPPIGVLAALYGMSALLFNWALALIFLSFCLIITARSRNIGKSSLSSAWTIASFAIYAILFIMGTAQGGAYITYVRAFYRLIRVTRQDLKHKADLANNLLYAFYALWYATAFFIGTLNFRAHSVARRAGAVDKVLKTLLFFALPLYVCHVIEDLAFTIIDSPAGLKSNNFEVYERANLAEIILMNTFHAGTIIVLILLGLRKSNWTSNASSDPWNKGYYPSYPSYPMQPAYMPVQTTEYAPQMNYTMQNQYVDGSNAHPVPQHTQ